MNPDLLLQHFDRISEAPDAIPRLRRFILDLAVRGKLVEQDPNDEPAAELLKRIQAEKERLGITPRRQDAKKGKKDSDSLGTLAPWRETGFDVPFGWEWVKLGEICSKTGSGSTPRGGKVAYLTEGVPFLRSQNVYDDGLRLNNVAFISEATHKQMNGTAVQPGDLLLNITGGSIGRCAQISTDFSQGNINQHVAIIRITFAELNDFTHKIILSPYFQNEIFSSLTGAGREGLPKNKMDEIAIPLPPLAEQHRIVAKVNELMALCDQLQIARNERETRRNRLVASSLNRISTTTAEEAKDATRFHLNLFPRLTTRIEHIKQLQQTILNLAVRGRLVPQDLNDEPASELLKLVAIERTELVKSGRLRKEKPLSHISTDQLPFEIYDSWKWAKIGDAALFTEYGTSQQSHHMESGVPVLKMGDIQNGKLLLGGQKKVPLTIDDLPTLYLHKYDLLYNRTNSAELVGKTGIYLGNDNEYTFASYLIRIRCSKTAMNSMYFNLAMNAPYFRETQINPQLKQQCGQANVNGTILKNMLIPLPPLAEQYRIVAKVDELMALCDQLETQLITTEADSCRMLEAMLRDALNASAMTN